MKRSAIAFARGARIGARAEYRAVEPGERWPVVRAAQHGDLMTQHQYLDVLCASERASSASQLSTRVSISADFRGQVCSLIGASFVQ
jgi:hypothetical protein